MGEKELLTLTDDQISVVRLEGVNNSHFTRAMLETDPDKDGGTDPDSDGSDADPDSDGSDKDPDSADKDGTD